jgi:hypothetical protein
MRLKLDEKKKELEDEAVKMTKLRDDRDELAERVVLRNKKIEQLEQ